jgi:hypothetical protein
MGLKINLFEKILLGVILLLGIFGLTMYIQNSSLKSDIIRKQDSLYVSVQNQAALASQLKLKSDSIQTVSLFVSNLQTALSIKENQYNILNSQFTTAKKEWERIKNGSAIITEDSITIRINEYDKASKVTVQGHTAFYPKEKNLQLNSSYVLKFSQEGFTYKTRVFYDLTDKLLMSKIYADGQLISTVTSEMDSSIFLMIKKGEPILPPKAPGFFDKLRFGAFAGAHHSDIMFIKNWNQYKFYADVHVSYVFSNSDISFYKPIFEPGFYVGVNYWMSTKQIYNSIFK